jgi:hypothetical protein
MASRSPILAIGPTDDDLAEIIQATKSGLISDFDNEQQLELHLWSYFNGTITERNEMEVSRYSRRELTKNLAGLLNDLRSDAS